MQALYMNDSYLKEFSATVVNVDNKYVVLDNTAFYPNSGGQLHDTGRIVSGDEEYSVVYVAKIGDKISHEVDKAGLNAGDAVRGIIDWNRRYTLMRMHTAAHLLSAVFHKEAGALITGNQLGIDQSRIDFSLENFDRSRIVEYIKTANDMLKKELPVAVRFIRKENMTDEMVKLAGALPPDADEIRLVDIVGVDMQADGGTHVKNTAEVGIIEIVKMENKGKSNRRIYFTVK